MKIKYALVALVIALIGCDNAILPRSYDPIAICDHAVPGRVFDDCLDPQWQNISAWQLAPGSDSVHSYTKFDNSKLVSWDFVDEPKRGKVLEIIYNDFHSNGAFVMNSAEAGARSDMSDYAQGYIEFDVKLMDAEAPYPHLVVKIDCGYPCQSAETLIDDMQMGEWQKVKLPLAPLIEQGMDITQVSSAVVVVPPWSQMRGYHYRLDNIRWVAPEGATAPEAQSTSNP